MAVMSEMLLVTSGSVHNVGFEVHIKVVTLGCLCASPTDRLASVNV